MLRKNMLVAAWIAGAVIAAGPVQAETLLWYRFEGTGASVTNKASPGTMDGTLKSINTWGSLAGLGDASSKFPTRGEAFPGGVALFDPASGLVYGEAAKGLSFSGDPANSGTVLLPKADVTAAFREMTSLTCEAFFRLPTDGAAIETRRAMDILFPIVDWGSPDGGGKGFFLGLRKDGSSTGFCLFTRYKYYNGSKVTQDELQSRGIVNDGNWHHLALSISTDATTHDATVKLALDYTQLASKTISGFTGFHTNDSANFPFLVGADLWRSSKSCCFVGEIAEVRVSDVALAPEEMMRPLSPGPVDGDTLLYLPMGDSGWFGARSSPSYENKWHGILPATTNVAWTPYWVHGTTNAVYPAISPDAAADTVRGGYLSGESFADTNSVFFSRALVGSTYDGHVVRIPYEQKGLADGSFTLEWFFRTDGQVPSGDSINTYTMLNNSFAKILVNQADGKLLTRLVRASGWQDFTTTVRVDDAAWHHYALVYDIDQEAACVYLDYRLVNTATNKLTTATSAEFILGGQTAYNQGFVGNLDDFRIVKRALRPHEFLTSRALGLADAALLAHFDGDYSTGQDSAIAPDAVGGTLGGGSAPAFVDVCRRIDFDNDGKADYESAKALRLDGGSVVWPRNSILECRDFTVEWFGKYESLEDTSMMLRLGWKSDDGTGSLCWALYPSPEYLYMAALVSPTGAWSGQSREDKPFVSRAAAGITDGKWHHWALVAESRPDAAPANTAFKLYRDYEQIGDTLVFDKKGEGGILALPTAGTTLSIGTAGHAINGVIDELRIRPGVQPVSSFMRWLHRGFSIVVR